MRLFIASTDYTAALDAENPLRIVRRLNRPGALTAALVTVDANFAVPQAGARVVVEREDGAKLFTGYLTDPPQREYLGFGERGPTYRYRIAAASDELLLDRKVLPERAPFVARPAGEILTQLAEDLLPGAFDTTNVEDAATLATYSSDSELTWSEHAAGIAVRSRAAYRAHDGKLFFAPVGVTTHAIGEDTAPDGLRLQPADRIVNDVTVAGRLEPRSHVKNYFLGDGVSLGFTLSHVPFTRRNVTVMEEEFREQALASTHWLVSDPQSAISVTSGKLRAAGGNDLDGATVIQSVESVELGGALILQHGEAAFTAASNGVLGGLYGEGVSIPDCVAGFRVTKTGGQSAIQPLINGALAGTSLTTASGHRYSLTTRIYARQIYRREQTFHSSTHPAGNGRGGATISTDARVVLELHDIDNANPGTQGLPATVLFDGIVTNLPLLCTYAPVNALDLHCDVAYTRVGRLVDAEVRSAQPSQAFRTRLLGFVSEGAECLVTDFRDLLFYSQHVPVPNEQIKVTYRSRGRALARIVDEASIAALANGNDDGVRGAVRRVIAPSPRTALDCENAALALLDDALQPAWAGEYGCWSDLLASDVLPGDAVAVNAPSRAAVFTAIVREVELEALDLLNDRSRYRIAFANDAYEALGFVFDPIHLNEPLEVTATSTTSGTAFIADVPDAEVTQITSTTVSIDAGAAPPAGGGYEVRRGDFGWGQTDDRNLVGRFTTQAFSVARLTRVQTYYVRQFDNASPPKYSRYSTVLHVDYPL